MLACQNMGGDLASISTREEEDPLMAAIKQLGGFANLNWNNYWIGVKKNGLDITWVTGDKIQLVGEVIKGHRGRAGGGPCGYLKGERGLVTEGGKVAGASVTSTVRWGQNRRQG